MQHLSRVAVTVFKYRWLTYELVLRDLKLRYRGSVLGFAWTLLNPLLFMAIYTLVFSVYLHTMLADYPLYLLSALVPWNWFASSLQQGISAIPDGRMYVGKTLFPIELLILVPVLSNSVNYVLSMVFVFVLAIVLGAHLGWSLLALPAIAAIELVFVLAVTFLAATFNVFYRDLQQLVVYAITALFFITPIFYARSSVPAKFHFLVTWNPLAAMISAYHNILYYGTLPDAGSLVFFAVLSVIALLVALVYFQRYRDFFGEYV